MFLFSVYCSPNVHSPVDYKFTTLASRDGKYTVTEARLRFKPRHKRNPRKTNNARFSCAHTFSLVYNANLPRSNEVAAVFVALYSHQHIFPFPCMFGMFGTNTLPICSSLLSSYACWGNCREFCPSTRCSFTIPNFPFHQLMFSSSSDRSNLTSSCSSSVIEVNV